MVDMIFPNGLLKISDINEIKGTSSYPIKIELDDTAGKVKISKNSTTEDLELQVKIGDSIVFKAVS